MTPDMTAAEPLGELGLPTAHLLTAAEYTQLGETEWGYTELVEGRILVSSSPSAMLTWNRSPPISPAWCADRSWSSSTKGGRL